MQLLASVANLQGNLSSSCFSFLSDYYNLHFSYHSNLFNPLVKHRVFSFSDYIAEISGLIGLVAGISLTSIVELFYFLSHKLFSKRETLRDQRQAWETSADGQQEVKRDHVIRKCLNFFVEFIKSSGIHGIIYTVDDHQNLPGKVFWTVVFVVSTISCGYLITDNKKHADLDPVAFQIDEKIWKSDEVRLETLTSKNKLRIRVFQIEFPAITFCPEPDMRKYYDLKACSLNNWGCEGMERKKA
jgi:hypothetical protein